MLGLHGKLPHWMQAAETTSRWKSSWLFQWAKKKYLGGGNSKIFGIFTPKIGEDEPNLTITFFKWVETTNQILLMATRNPVNSPVEGTVVCPIGLQGF